MKRPRELLLETISTPLWQLMESTVRPDGPTTLIEPLNSSRLLFMQRCLLKFARALQEGGMKPEEAFRYCDPKQLGKIEASSLTAFIDSTIRTDFREREKFALANYLDVNKSGHIERKDFMKELEKANEINLDPNRSRIILSTQEKRDFPGNNGAVTDSLFKSDMPAVGDQAAAGPGRAGTNGVNFETQGAGKGTQASIAPSYSRPQLSETDTEGIEALIKKIEKITPIGRFLLEVLNTCEMNNAGIIGLEELNRFLSARYGNVLTAKDRPLLSKALDVNKTGKVDLFELRNFFKSFCPKTSFLDFSMRLLAKQIDKAMISTSEFLVSKKIDLTQRIAFDMFCNIMPDLVKCDLRECSVLFKEIDKREEGTSSHLPN